MAQLDYGVVTGGGPGKAMKGIHYCIHKAKGLGPTGGRCIMIPSGLNDEPSHSWGERDFICTPQGNIMLRELMIIGIATSGGIFYAGNKGSLFEYAAVDLMNYCDGRSTESIPGCPLIAVDLPGVQFVGQSFYAPQTQQLKNAVSMRLGKLSAVSRTHTVYLPSIDRRDPNIPFDTSDAAITVAKHLTQFLVSSKGRMSDWVNRHYLQLYHPTSIDRQLKLSSYDPPERVVDLHSAFLAENRPGPRSKELLVLNNL